MRYAARSALVALLALLPSLAFAQGLSQCQLYPWFCPPPAFQTETARTVHVQIGGLTRDVVAVTPYITSERHPVLVTMHGIVRFDVMREGEPVRMGADVHIRRTTGSVETEDLDVVDLARTSVFVDLSSEEQTASLPVTLTFIDSGRFGRQHYSALAAGRNFGAGLATFAAGDWTIQVLEMPR